MADVGREATASTSNSATNSGRETAPDYPHRWTPENGVCRYCGQAEAVCPGIVKPGREASCPECGHATSDHHVTGLAGRRECYPDTDRPCPCGWPAPSPPARKPS